ncbi:MAG: deoxyribose-phosphate aldolase [Candidatus Hadarchaeia archaeon]
MPEDDTVTVITERIPDIIEKARKISISPDEMASKIDHTELSPAATRNDLEKLCEEAKNYNFRSVTISPYYTQFCAKKLEDVDVLINPTIGFPLGQNKSEIKSIEAEMATEDGADELDMVMNVGAFREGKYDLVKSEIKEVVSAASGKPVKVIIESGYLTYEEISKASKIIRDAGADYVKNSTGFGPYGANIPHICQIKETIGEDLGIKAAGGIGNFRDALKLVAAGADVIGTSSGSKIIESYESIDQESWTVNDPCSSCPSKWVSKSGVPKDIEDYYIGKCDSCRHR